MISLKEIRLRPKTDPHDRSIKVQHARDFLDEGHKVQFTMLFKGRERAHRDLATGIFNDIVNELGDAVKIERPPLMDGKRMTMIVVPGKKGSGPFPASPSAAARPASPGAAARPTLPSPPAVTALESPAAPEPMSAS